MSSVSAGKAADAADASDSHERTRQRAKRMGELLEGNDALQSRLRAVMSFARRVRVSEYHLTQACNIRCKGCWFFEYGHDTATKEVTSLQRLEQFLERERTERKVNAALIIGGEPTLFPKRVELFVRKMKYVTISSNGLIPFPREGFERVAVALTLFGGGPLDDVLRGIKPNGSLMTGLFDRMLENYHYDPRAKFIYAITEDGIGYIDDTVRRIRDNGNHVTFNFYSKYGTNEPDAMSHTQELLEEALRVKDRYPETVLSTPYYIKALVTGESHWDKFGYHTCPSISIDNPEHAERLANGNPTLPFFNTWAADLETLKFCCTSGHCEGCRDSQAIFSWLLVSVDAFLGSTEQLQTWVEIAESYWRQFCWCPLHVSGEIKLPPAEEVQQGEALCRA